MRSTLSDPVVLAFMLSQLVISTALYYLFPAMVLRWTAEFQWSLAQVMGAFSIALGMQGLVSRKIGRLIDAGLGPVVMASGALISVAGLILLTHATALWHFYAIWAVLGLAMGMTLYDAVFALIIRSRGDAAMDWITVITLVSGLASSAAFTLTAVIGDLWGWRSVLWVLAIGVLCIHLPLIVFATCRLERGIIAKLEIASTPTMKVQRRSGYWTLTIAVCLSALGIGMILSHLLPLLRWLGIDSGTALIAAALIGPSQVIGRLVIAFSARNWDKQSLAIICLFGLAAAPAFLLVSAFGSAFVFAFAMMHGACYGISSILRPIVIREILGHTDFGASQGAVLGPAFIAFGSAPFLAGVMAETQGYLSVFLLCIATQAIGAMFLRISPQAERLAA